MYCDKMELKLSGRGKERDAEILSVAGLESVLKKLRNEKQLDEWGDSVCHLWIKLCKNIGNEVVSANFEGREARDTFDFSFEREYVRMRRRA